MHAAGDANEGMSSLSGGSPSGWMGAFARSVSGNLSARQLNHGVELTQLGDSCAELTCNGCSSKGTASQPINIHGPGTAAQTPMHVPAGTASEATASAAASSAKGSKRVSTAAAGAGELSQTELKPVQQQQQPHEGQPGQQPEVQQLSVRR